MSHRCPPAVTKFAQRALAGDALSEARDESLVISRIASEQQWISSLKRKLARLSSEDGDASVAIVCRDVLAAQKLVRKLRPDVTVRSGIRNAGVRAGVVAAGVNEVKGLEFDFVILADPSDYPENAAGRRALYLAATRARWQLWLRIS